MTHEDRPERPAPLATDDSHPFWSAAAEGRLVAQRCGGCARLHHPPRPMCPTCGSIEHVWEDLDGRGSVYSYTVLHHPRHPAFDYPLIAVLVDLDEGIRVLSNLVDIEPAEVRIGQRVQVSFVPAGDGASLPVFRPESRL
jgi:uncharacterized OB-fold protein